MTLGLRLTLLNGLLLLLTVGAFTGVAYATQKEALQRNVDQSLEDQARWFSDNSEVWLDPVLRRPAQVSFPNPNRFAGPEVFIQITMRDGRTEARSQNLGNDRLPLDLTRLERALGGATWFEEIELDGQPLRVFSAPLRVDLPRESGAPIGVIQVARPVVPLHNTLNILQTTLLSVGVVGILASLLVGWLLARAALRPIERLGTTAHAIGMARDFSRRVPVSPGRQDEVGRLAEDFNRMLEQLQSAYDRVETALDAQRRFVADASHELRTPLTSLRGNLELLRQSAALRDSGSGPRPPASGGDAWPRAPEGAAGAEDGQLLDDLVAETERLARLVADLLLLARADAGQHLSLAPVELGPLVRDSFRAARFLREGVSLYLEEEEPGGWVRGDPDKLKQLLLILLDNALKFTPAGGSVYLGVRSGPEDRVALYVRDTGPGIPEAERGKIFDRFYRLDQARAAGGSGLGLAIARWIVDEHGGSIGVESTPGEGSTFTVFLPAIPSATPTQGAVAAGQASTAH